MPGRIVRAVDIPVIVDIDTGYGNPLTVWRIVKDLESMGSSGIFLEDQVWPKRCTATWQEGNNFSR